MMIIDIHTHAFPEKIAGAALRSMQGNSHTALFSDGTVSGLSRAERSAGVDLAVIQPVATNPEKVSHLNNAAMETNQSTQSTGLYSFGAMHPSCTYWESELERIKAAGIVGIKLHPPYAGVDIDDAKYIAILRKCKELNLMVLIHSGMDVGLRNAREATPDKVRRAMDAVGPMKLVAAHMGGWDCWDEVMTLLPETGIYIDTAFSLGTIVPAGDDYPWKPEELEMLSEAKFEAVIRCFGTDHVLYGTDSPWADPGCELAKLKKALPNTEELEMILGKNAERLLLSAGFDIHQIAENNSH